MPVFSFINRFIDWFLMRDDSEVLQLQGPAQLTQGVDNVTVILADPTGKFASNEARDALKEGLINPLNNRDGIYIRSVAKSFRKTNRGSITDQFKEVIEKGRAVLEEEKADLLIWGNVELEEQAVRWYFLSAQDAPANLGVPGIAENILIPFDPEPPVLDVLYAAIFAATAPNHPSQALKIGEHLLSAVDPLTKLPAGLSARKTSATCKASVMGMGAIVLANIARRGEELGWFDPAIKAFETWQELVEKDKQLQDWAFTKNHQGWLFEQFASHKEDEEAVTHINEAISIFEDVSAVFTQQQYPLEWAALQDRIAGTCVKVGRRLGEADFLQKAARYYKKSIEVYTVSTYPVNWAEAMSKMGKTLMYHGQLIKGSQSLEQAGVAFQSVLKVYTKEAYPDQWASTQNNLGATLFALANRDHSTPEWLDHALTCFMAAREYYLEQEKQQLVHVIDKNIKRARDLRIQIQEEWEREWIE